jgi:hypothetical protein
MEGLGVTFACAALREFGVFKMLGVSWFVAGFTAIEATTRRAMTIAEPANGKALYRRASELSLKGLFGFDPPVLCPTNLAEATAHMT